MGGATSNWISSVSWNTQLNGLGTARSLSIIADILVFDGANIGGTVLTTGTVTPTFTSSDNVAQFKMINETNFVLQRRSSPSSATSNLVVYGDATLADDVTLDASNLISTIATLKDSYTAAKQHLNLAGSTVYKRKKMNV